MIFGQLLMGEGRPKIRIAIFQPLNRLGFDLAIQLVVAGVTALF